MCYYICMKELKISDRIKQRREELGISVSELAQRLGKNRATVYRYESNDIENMPSSVLEPLAQALHTTPAYLMGWDDNQSHAELPKYANVYPVEPFAKIPVLGIIRAGKPICTDQNNYDEWDYADAKYSDGQHFMVRVVGDSMSPTIPDGSLAIIKFQDTAEKGQIVAFAMDGEYATLKRYFPQPDGSILLRADNPNADSYIVTQEQLRNNEAFILGVCRSYKVNL